MNFIPDTNPFNLSTPPVWWLTALNDFDNMLVVIPSRMQPLYRLARRRQFSPGIGALAVLDTQADTAMLAGYGLVPVTSIMVFGQWTLGFLNELRKRDIWAAGGGDRFVDEIEAMEERETQRKRSLFRSDMDHRARDAYRSLKARTGQSVAIVGGKAQGRSGRVQIVNSTELPLDVRGVPSGSTASVR